MMQRNGVGDNGLWTELRCSRCRYRSQHPGSVMPDDLARMRALCGAPPAGVTVFRFTPPRRRPDARGRDRFRLAYGEPRHRAEHRHEAERRDELTEIAPAGVDEGLGAQAVARAGAGTRGVVQDADDHRAPETRRRRGRRLVCFGGEHGQRRGARHGTVYHTRAGRRTELFLPLGMGARGGRPRFVPRGRLAGAIGADGGRRRVGKPLRPFIAALLAAVEGDPHGSLKDRHGLWNTTVVDDSLP